MLSKNFPPNGARSDSVAFSFILSSGADVFFCLCSDGHQWSHQREGRMRWGETVFHSFLPVCVLPFWNFNVLPLLSLAVLMQPSLIENIMWSLYFKTKMFVFLPKSSVVAENDFLHTLLNKVTSSRGDSGGQGIYTVYICIYTCFWNISFLSTTLQLLAQYEPLTCLTSSNTICWTALLYCSAFISLLLLKAWGIT